MQDTTMDDHAPRRTDKLSPRASIAILAAGTVGSWGIVYLIVRIFV